jgi:hypothetical protein
VKFFGAVFAILIIPEFKNPGAVNYDRELSAYYQKCLAMGNIFGNPLNLEYAMTKLTFDGTTGY